MTELMTFTLGNIHGTFMPVLPKKGNVFETAVVSSINRIFYHEHPAITLDREPDSKPRPFKRTAEYIQALGRAIEKASAKKELPTYVCFDRILRELGVKGDDVPKPKLTANEAYACLSILPAPEEEDHIDFFTNLGQELWKTIDGYKFGDARTKKQDNRLIDEPITLFVSDYTDKQVLTFLANLLYNAFIEGTLHPARDRFAGQWYSDVRTVLQKEDITGYK